MLKWYLVATLFKNKWIDLPVGVGSVQVPQMEGYLLFTITFHPAGGSSKLNSVVWTSTNIDYNISGYKFSADIIYIKYGVLS